MSEKNSVELPRQPLDATSIQSLLTTKSLGRPLHIEDHTDSTNAQLLKLGQQGAPHGTTLLAETQSGGHGRRGRPWHSPPGVNLYLSTLLRPPLEPRHVAPITLGVAVAVARALTQTAHVHPTLKWPNDLLLSGKKIAGILTEMRTLGDTLSFLVIGVGVNVNTQQFPPHLATTATSLALHTGSPHSRETLTASLLNHLEDIYELFVTQGPHPILDEWKRLPNMLGQRVCIKPPGPKTDLQGIARDLDQDGALLLETPDGHLQRILSGDLVQTTDTDQTSDQTSDPTQPSEPPSN